MGNRRSGWVIKLQTDLLEDGKLIKSCGGESSTLYWEGYQRRGKVQFTVGVRTLTRLRKMKVTSVKISICEV